MKKGVDIYSIVKELELCKEEVDSKLAELAKKQLPDREKEFNHTFETLEGILKIIGTGLFNAAKKVANVNDDFIFYFWPGYTALNEKRVLIRGEVERFDEKGKKYFTGIGFNGSEDKVFYDCPSTLYFDAVLMTHNNFIPPSTHNWKRQQNDELKIRLRDQSNLKILIIERANKHDVIAKNEQILHLTFDGGEVDKSVDELSKFLNADSEALKIEPQKLLSEYVPWPLNSWYKKDEFEIINEQNLYTAQKLIYPVWFASTFCDRLCNYDKTQQNGKWIAQVKKKLEKLGYPDLKERIENYQAGEIKYLGDEKYHPIHFSHWYSLFFDNYDTSQELGSAMFLTNAALPKEFLFYVMHWLKFMYSQIRGLDYATKSELNMKKSEWEKNFTKLHHSQVRYFEALRVYVENSKMTKKDKKAIALYKDILEGFLEVAKEIDNLDEYVKSKGETAQIDISAEVNDSVNTMKLLFQNKEVALRSFKLRDSVFNSYSKNLKNNRLFQGNFEKAEGIIINSYPNLVRLILKDLILNAISYCDVNSPVVKIDFKETAEFIFFRIENNRIPNSKEELDKIINPDSFVGKYGIQIIKALKDALKWEMTFPTDYSKLKKTGKFYFKFKIPKK